jgi:membrane-associated phospholipid phosphatase
MNLIAEEIQEADKYIKRNFTGNNLGIPSEVDKALKWLPAVIFFLTKTKNSTANKIKIFLVAETVRNCLIRPVKKLTKRRRPDSIFKRNSFPSSHTATSFMGAEMIRSEINQFTPVSTFSYTIATSTALLRVYKRKHWASDVVAGALIGVISAKLAHSVVKKIKQ